MANHQRQFVQYTGPPGAPPQHPPPPPPQSEQPTASSSRQPVVAVGDWTKSLVDLAKTAELKKHALTLQLQTAHILAAHASLEQKAKSIQDIKEQKNKLDSERQRLLTCLRQVNEDRDKADLLQATIEHECTDLRERITRIENGEYNQARREVDRLRAELKQPPLPSVQSTLDERSSQFLTEKRLNGEPGKRPRGRPKGSKTRPKVQPQDSN
ncbi:hypothetical protein CYLTODRAFT_419227 [Cylindrobasidium torrendii FP15055 ss-10]|uniref:Uncharacterized protein n=1 Tax=Cylindrobasidium torrendii FP15055 ss-10 TaxID=1314674 RepID=A0A0D7BLR5_9AGAR|nr:hypothetical protein CYLTODRAFT_419227 [Cylindrobasidium torrendii FP15055 ss-10]